MIIYQNPYFLAEIENKIFKNFEVLTREQIVEELIAYVKYEIQKRQELIKL